jgi:uncharacterized membrane protein YphA (DoxX/SURF4 family)
MPRRYAPRVQRAFSTFPFGLTGFALAAFRICVASQSLVRFWPAAWHYTTWLTVAAVTLALALLLGIGTPFVATALALARLVRVVAFEPGWDSAPVFDIAYALILATLGPGAYSLDAMLYGRRRIEVCRDASQENSSRGD